MKFEDKSYTERRDILRKYIKDNADTYELVNFIMYHMDEIKDMTGCVNKDLVISTLLVDGYVAFERVFSKNKTKIIGYNLLDPATLLYRYNGGFSKNVWEVHFDNPTMKRVLFEEQVVYLSYSDYVMTDHDSFVAQCYMGQITKKNVDIIKIVIEKLHECYIHFDENAKRRSKLKRVLNGQEL